MITQTTSHDSPGDSRILISDAKDLGEIQTVLTATGVTNKSVIG